MNFYYNIMIMRAEFCKEYPKNLCPFLSRPQQFILGFNLIQTCVNKKYWGIFVNVILGEIKWWVHSLHYLFSFLLIAILVCKMSCPQQNHYLKMAQLRIDTLLNRVNNRYFLKRACTDIWKYASCRSTVLQSASPLIWLYSMNDGWKSFHLEVRNN